MIGACAQLLDCNISHFAKIIYALLNEWLRIKWKMDFHKSSTSYFHSPWQIACDSHQAVWKLKPNIIVGIKPCSQTVDRIHIVVLIFKKIIKRCPNINLVFSLYLYFVCSYVGYVFVSIINLLFQTFNVIQIYRCVVFAYICDYLLKLRLILANIQRKAQFQPITRHQYQYCTAS